MRLTNQKCVPSATHRQTTSFGKKGIYRRDVQNIEVRSASRVGRGDHQEFQVLGEDEEK